LAGLLTGYELDVIEGEMLLAQLPMMMMLS
jgi:hypothetical protein